MLVDHYYGNCHSLLYFQGAEMKEDPKSEVQDFPTFIVEVCCVNPNNGNT